MEVDTFSSQKNTSRRSFVKQSLAMGSAVFLGFQELGCSSESLSEKARKRGSKRTSFGFIDESNIPLGVTFGEGLGGRYYNDLSRVDPYQLRTNKEFFVRTRSPIHLPKKENWSVHISSQGEKPTSWKVHDWKPWVQDQGTYVLECSGNQHYGQFGLLGMAQWDGILVKQVLDLFYQRAGRPFYDYILIKGYDEHRDTTSGIPGASWVFRLDELLASGAFLATGMNGGELPVDHGAPLRLIVPGWYGCVCIKWIQEIQFVPGHFPATEHMKEYAYRTHQIGEPMRVQEYVPATMQKAATPVRIEQWSVDGDLVYRLVGIAWGGNKPSKQLEIQLGRGNPWVPVEEVGTAASKHHWVVWSHWWDPEKSGLYEIALRDPDNRSIRLNSGYYSRRCRVT